MRVFQVVSPKRRTSRDLPFDPLPPLDGPVTFERLKERAGREGFDTLLRRFIVPFRWGSCQYDTAAAVVEMARRCSLSSGQVAELMGVPFKAAPGGEKNARFKAWVAMETERTRRLPEKMKKDHPMWHPSWVERAKEWKRKRLSALRKVATPDDAFSYLRKSAHDLWFAVPDLFNAMYDAEAEAHRVAPGCGPVCNVMVQGHNYEVGLKALRMIEDGVITGDRCLKGFDT